MADEDKSIIIFGQDITKIPCFRNSFLYGISGGLGAGLFYFMLTSKPLMASHCGMASFTAITLVYWFQCRYNYSKTRFEMMRIQKLLRQQAVYEGTGFEKEIENELKEKGVMDV
ncbi:Cytochrome c oxidase assembly protein COX20 [Popillia japonica]|uniref:Cytochrome c oxidase assembly protein COX20, mitochondrial n=1 Tax=Popillia japonica TaxID=7064 RepID=A0AAW1N3N8_POPJA